MRLDNAGVYTGKRGKSSGEHPGRTRSGRRGGEGVEPKER